MNQLPRREAAARRTGAGLACLPLLLLALGGCAEAHNVELSAPSSAPEAPNAATRIDAALYRALDERGVADVVVLLTEPDSASATDLGLSHTTSGATVQSATPYAATQERILAALAPDTFEVLHRFDLIPYLHLRVRSESTLERLAELSDVQWLYENQLYTASLTESLALIKQPPVQAQGLVGAGTAVAVLDTGCDYTKSDFGSCSAPGGDCKVAFARDFATEDNTRDASGHGTNVSAIVLGVAPATKVLALDVFAGESASSTSILAAIDWVVQNRSTYNISAMNLSLGSGLFTAACPNDVFAAAMARARTAGVLPVAATGNNGAINAVASPACVPGVVSVGAVYDAASPGMSFPAAKCSDTSPVADKVACFSNSASFMSLLAPGARITAAGLTQSGTSQASPHVAGAAAVIRARFPFNSLDEVAARMTMKGPVISDPRNGVKKTRLDLSAAVADPVPPDVVPPAVSVVINQGASLTRVTQVSLTISASDAGSISGMCISNAETCATFTAFTTRPSWTLATADGVKKVNVWVKDAAGNVGKGSATITLDTKKPTDGVVSASAAVAAVNLSWSGFGDLNGIGGYVVVQGLDTIPASCLVGTEVYRGSATSFAHADLINGKLYSYRVCALDVAGNLSLGKGASARPAPEFTPPGGSLRINEGESFTASKNLTLTISGDDASTISAMCISTSASCKTWVPFTATSTLTVSVAAGTVKVNVWLRDEWLNAATTPISASIGVDTKAPVLGTLAAAPAPEGGLRLSWAAATDANSGVAGYRLVVAAGTTAPATCQAGLLLIETEELGFTHAARGTYSYRLCARDRVGNWTVGKTLKATAP